MLWIIRSAARTPAKTLPYPFKYYKIYFLFFSIANFRRKKIMRGGCSWTTLHKVAVFSVLPEIYNSQSSLKTWHKHSLTHLCVLVFLHSCHIFSLLCPQFLHSNSWKDTGIEEPFDRLHLAHLSIPKPKATGCKDKISFSSWTLPKKKKKKSLSEKNVAFQEISF